MKAKEEFLKRLTVLHLLAYVVEVDRLGLIEVPSEVVGHLLVAPPVLKYEFEAK